MEIEDKIKKNVKCCTCEGSLQNSKFVSSICLDKLATWEHPTWGNILVKDKYPEPRAIAILCDDCIRNRRKAKYAVEWNKDCSQVTYHPVEDLKDLPEIKGDDVLEAGKSEGPNSVIVRDAKTGEPVEIPITVFPLEFHPRIWCENAYWRYSGLLTQDEVMKYMKDEELTPDEAHKLGDYILIWVQNTACTAWLFMPQNERENYFKTMTPIIAKLHELLGKCKSNKEVKEMTWIAIEAGLDPF